jgi:hypothetical protein
MSDSIQITALDAGIKVDGPCAMEGYFGDKDKAGMMKYLKKTIEILRNSKSEVEPEQEQEDIPS